MFNFDLSRLFAGMSGGPSTSLGSWNTVTKPTGSLFSYGNDGGIAGLNMDNKGFGKAMGAFGEQMGAPQQPASMPSAPQAAPVDYSDQQAALKAMIQNNQTARQNRGAFGGSDDWWNIGGRR